MQHEFFIDEIDERMSRFEDGGVLKAPGEKITGYLAMTILPDCRWASDSGDLWKARGIRSQRSGTNVA